MSWVSLDLRDGKRAYRPGETVEGAARWELEAPPSRVEVRLFWYTLGKGTQDVGVVATVSWEGPGNAEKRDFSLKLPEAPFSFSGKLISVLWALEVVVEPPADVARQEILVSPAGAEITLPVLPEKEEGLPIRIGSP
jgi:hypothetical protein